MISLQMYFLSHSCTFERVFVVCHYCVKIVFCQGITGFGNLVMSIIGSCGEKNIFSTPSFSSPLLLCLQLGFMCIHSQWIQKCNISQSLSFLKSGDKRLEHPTKNRAKSWFCMLIYGLAKHFQLYIHTF